MATSITVGNRKILRLTCGSAVGRTDRDPFFVARDVPWNRWRLSREPCPSSSCSTFNLYLVFYSFVKKNAHQSTLSYKVCRKACLQRLLCWKSRCHASLKLSPRNLRRSKVKNGIIQVIQLRHAPYFLVTNPQSDQPCHSAQFHFATGYQWVSSILKFPWGIRIPSPKRLCAIYSLNCIRMRLSKPSWRKGMEALLSGGFRIPFSFSEAVRYRRKGERSFDVFDIECNPSQTGTRPYSQDGNGIVFKASLDRSRSNLCRPWESVAFTKVHVFLPTRFIPTYLL